MKYFASLISATFLLPSLVAATWSKVTYDNTYDNAQGSMFNVACSNGDNGLVTRYGWQTFGDIPHAQGVQSIHIGGVQGVMWNSDMCGSCWKLTYHRGDGQSNSINVLAVDYAGDGFNIAQGAMDDLTWGQARSLGVAWVESVQVDQSECGI